VRVSALVPAPPDQVLEFVADSRNDPIWCENVESVEMLTEGPVEPGSRFRFHQHLDRPGGSRMQFDGEIEMIGRDASSVAWQVTDRFQQREVSIRVLAAPGGSRVTQETRATFLTRPGLARWVYPRLARSVFKRQFATLARHFAAS
jgi:hypothetical protein